MTTHRSSRRLAVGALAAALLVMPTTALARPSHRVAIEGSVVPRTALLAGLLARLGARREGPGAGG